jgi:hypothetical protein
MARVAMNSLTTLAAISFTSVLVAHGCADPVMLPPGVDADHDAPGDGDGDGSDSAGATSTQSCDDEATCEYDLETSCAGRPVADPSVLPTCPASVCSEGGHCVPAVAVPADQRSLLASCGGGSLCVPDMAIERGGLFTAPSCDSIGGAEGRCLSACIPSVAYRAHLLPQAGCGASERCVPCYDPFDGTDTGACTVSCDPGPAEPKRTLPACCADKGGGTCVPAALVGPDEADRLDADECAGLGIGDAVCVPDVILQSFLAEVPFTAVECTTGDLVQSLGLGAEGGCLPECIPIVDALPVTQETCGDGFKCVPCVDLDGDGTGACTI